MLRRLLVSLFLTALTPLAWGDAVSVPPPQRSPDEPQLWINLGGFSRHLSGNAHFNERNVGIGLEWRTSHEVAYMAGVYRNSVGKDTQYISLNWQPWQMGPVRLGAAIGVMNGYPSIRQGRSFFAAMPFASLEGRHVGLNVGLIPKLGDVQSAVVVQLKWRLR